MTQDQLKPFHKKFSAVDLTLFHTLVDGLVGNEIARVDRLYGGAISLHVGALVPGRRRDRGTWIVTVWGGDLRLHDSEQRVLDRSPSSDARDQQIMLELAGFVGQAIERVELDVNDLALLITVANGGLIRIAVDPKFAGDAWAISLPSHQTLSVDQRRDWRLESNNASTKQNT